MSRSQKENVRWHEVERVFDAALEVDTQQRATFIEIECGHDTALRREVETLVEAYGKAAGFLAAPAKQAVVLKQALAPIPAGHGAKGTNGMNEMPGVVLADRLGPYRLIRELAQGGMGTVWLAERADEQFQQQVAIKLLKAEAVNEEALHRFRHERQVLAELNHPNIARLLDGGTTTDGRPYIVMEYIEGLSLDEYCRQQQLALDECLRLFRQVCAAVQYAHQHLLIHRDLKPGNILVTADGTPKLLDFGIVKLLQPDLTKSYDTVTGLNPMTPAYASPEQVRGEKLTTASDVYSLGVVLYELLTGRSPYQLQAHTFGELVKAICEQEPVKLSSAVTKSQQINNESQGSSSQSLRPLTRNLKGDLDSIVLMALRKEPLARYSSVEQFSDDLRRYLEGLPTRARKGTFSYRAAKYIRRHKVPVTAAALIALSLLGGISATWQQAVIARAAQVRAENALTMAEERKQQAEAARNEADQQRTKAELQKLLADEQRTRAEQGEETKRQLLYAAQMRLAQQAWNEADIERMRELLDTQMPQPGHRDLRGFEWYYLWRLAHSDLATLKHTGELSSIVVTPDGAKMASQTLFGGIRIWETATGKELAPIQDGEANPMHLSLSPDGKFFAQSKSNKQIKIYAVSNGAHLSTLEFGQKEGAISTFSPDGKLLAAATTDGTVSVWAVPTWKQLASFKAFADAVTAIVFTPDSKQLLTGGREIGIKVWDPLSGRVLRTIPIGPGVVGLAMAFIPGSNNVVSSHIRNGGLKIWDFATGRQITEIKTTVALGGLSCSPDGKMIATGHYEKVVRLWSAKSGALLAEIKTHSGSIKAVAFTSDGKGLFTGSSDKTVKLRNVQEISETKLLVHNPAYVYNVAFTRDGRRLITGDDGQVVRIYDQNTGQELHKLEGHQQLPLAIGDPARIIKIAVSPTGGYFATSGYDGTVRTWGEKTGKPLRVFDAHTRGLYGITISADGRFIASGGNDTLVKVWDTVTGREWHTLRGHTKRVSAAAFSPQGKYLATCDEAGDLKLWDYVKGTEVCTLHPYTNILRNLAFSSDGKLLALGGDDRYIVLLDTSTWRTVKTLKGHTQFVTTLEFSPDGKRLVASGRDYTTRVWELEQGQEVLTLRGHTCNVMDIGFSPDGTSLATVACDGKLLLWQAATPREVIARTSGGIQPLRANASADALQNLLATPPVPNIAPLEIADQKINGWYKGNSPMYAALPDRSVSLSNKASAQLVSKKPDEEGFAMFAQSIRADLYRGKRVRVSGYLKGLEANKTATLLFRVDGAGVNTLELGNDAKSTTADWMKYEVVLNVPNDALTLTFGFILNGSGKLWGDDFRLEIVDVDVPVTGPGGLREQSQQRFLLRPEAERSRLIQQAQENAKRLPLKPINMDFEQ